MSERGGSSANGRPLKPTLAANRNVKSPITPRIAGSASPSVQSSSMRRTPTVRNEAQHATPSLKHDDTPSKDAISTGNITPRSSARKARADNSASTPEPSESPLAPKLRRTTTTPGEGGERASSAIGAGTSSTLLSGRPKTTRPKSVITDNGSRATSPLVRSPGFVGSNQLKEDRSIDSRFFHASDATKQEPAPKKAEPRKPVAFFYADGKEEEGKNRKSVSPRASSPVLSAVSEKRSNAPWLRSSRPSNPSRSPPMLSPAQSSVSNSVSGNSPYFAAATGQARQGRSPSPSKENIHLSYRKGASQIFGTRPSSMAALREPDPPSPNNIPFRRESVDKTRNITPHRKSPSLSSIDSGNSPHPRRRSATTVEIATNTPSPLGPHHPPTKAATAPRLPSSRPDLPTTSSYRDDPNPLTLTTETTPLSPIKHTQPTPNNDLAADARRERKVLDLEISNSSLLAINASLEREVRRQKTELKRFRRLSRAGRLSMPPAGTEKRNARFSEGLSAVDENSDTEGEDSNPTSGLSELYGDFSVSGSEDDEDEDGSSSFSTSAVGQDPDHRLAKDEKRLQVDLAKHKELLVQSQMMNQSLKRCLFATEDMIAEGRKSLAYHVKVDEVVVGGRVLVGDDDEEGERNEEFGEFGEEWDGGVGDETVRAAEDGLGLEGASQGFLGVWQGLGRDREGGHGGSGSVTSVGVASGAVTGEGSEAGDRDSGIEVDKPPRNAAFQNQGVGGLGLGRPPEHPPSAEVGETARSGPRTQL